VSTFDVIESPMIEQALGIPTLQEIDFWGIMEGQSNAPLKSIKLRPDPSRGAGFRGRGRPYIK
jgi:hypothetical protein